MHRRLLAPVLALALLATPLQAQEVVKPPADVDAGFTEFARRLETGIARGQGAAIEKLKDFAEYVKTDEYRRFKASRKKK